MAARQFRFSRELKATKRGKVLTHITVLSNTLDKRSEDRVLSEQTTLDSLEDGSESRSLLLERDGVEFVLSSLSLDVGSEESEEEDVLLSNLCRVHEEEEREEGKNQRAESGRDATGKGGREWTNSQRSQCCCRAKNTRMRVSAIYSAKEKGNAELSKRRNSRSINSPQHQRSIQRKLHVGSSRSLRSSRRDLNTNVGSGDDNLSEGNRVIGDEDDLR